MKKTNLIINGVLVVAVIALFVLNFIDRDESGSEAYQMATDTSMVQSGDLKIAYFDIDSVMSNWDLFTKIQVDLTAKEQKIQTELQSKAAALQKRQEELQYKINRQLIMQMDAEKEYQQIMTDDQNLQLSANTNAQQLQQESIVKQRLKFDELEKSVNNFSKAKGYTYIFSYTFAGNLYPGVDAANITAIIIALVNEEYPVTEEN